MVVTRICSHREQPSSPRNTNSEIEVTRIQEEFIRLLESPYEREIYTASWKVRAYRYFRTSWLSVRNKKSERSVRARFMIQINDCVNTIQSTLHVSSIVCHIPNDFSLSHSCKF